MAARGLGTVARLRELREELVAAAPSAPDWRAVAAWAAKAKPFFVNRLQAHLKDFEQLTAQPRWTMLPRVGGAPGSEGFNRDARESENRTNTAAAIQKHKSLVAFVDGLLAELSDEPVVPAEPSAAVAPTTDVFIVHGRDEASKQSVARTLESLGLRPVILHEQANVGRTLIEKLEHHAAGSGFAVVILTPDDVGSLATDKATRPRARQNVILELGYFYGLLGRGRVVALLDPSVERPSDIEGIVWVGLDERGAWRLDLARELRAAGYDVDTNRLR
ncbi:MAG: TIR domain-containing protein [Candidatus Limnocylindrus sp.]